MSLYKKNFILNVIFVTVVTVALIVVVTLTSRTIVDRDARSRLTAVVEDAAEMVSRDYFNQEGEFEGVYITYFDRDGNYYCGYDAGEDADFGFDVDWQKNFPPFDGNNFPQEAPSDNSDMSSDDSSAGSFTPSGGEFGNKPFDVPGGDMFGKRNGETVWQRKIGNKNYYVCERVAFDSVGNVYIIRGLSAVGASPLNTVLIIFIITIFAVAVAALVISYFSLKKATRPIRQMTDELNRIEKSSDLSNRMSVATKDEEIQNLVNAYNEMLARVESILKSQERFTSDVSHELRSPLTVLLAESEFALNDLKTAEDKDKSLEAIYNQTRRLTVMVKQLLEFSRVVGTESVALTETDISALTEEIARVDNGDKDITVHCDVDENVVIKTDETLYIRMVTNLLDNAVKYGKHGGNVWITLKKADKVTLTVKDDGIGMSEETVSHVYERMYQADKSRSAGAGLGLGLSFVKEISRLLNCTVFVESKLGEGSAFIVTFR